MELEKDFVIRVTHDRNADDNEKTASKIRNTKAIGKVRVNIPRDTRRNIPAGSTSNRNGNRILSGKQKETGKYK